VIATRCPSCGTELAPDAKSCPVCHALVHAGRLKELAAEADAATAAGDASTAMARWN